VNDHHSATWCLLDPVCAAGVSAAASALVAVARRLVAVDALPRSQRGTARTTRRCVGGAIIAGTAAGAVCLLGGELWPGHMTAVTALTTLGGVAVDYSSEFAQRLLRAAMTTMARAYLEGSLPPAQPQVSPVRSSMPDDDSPDERLPL